MIKRIVERVGRERCGGFYTEEVLADGKRMGFRLVTLDGRERLLAHERIASPFHIGRYGVDVSCLEMLGVPAIAEAVIQRRLVVIDELGSMEAYSEAFRQAVFNVLDNPIPFVGTIALRSHPWLDSVKQHPRVKLCLLTASERETVFQQFLGYVQAALP